MKDRKIHKYILQTIDEQLISMPIGAKILTVQVQHKTPCLWVEVDTSKVTKLVTIYTHGAGHEVHEMASKYIGTYQLQGGTFVFHVYQGI